MRLYSFWKYKKFWLSALNKKIVKTKLTTFQIDVALK